MIFWPLIHTRFHNSLKIKPLQKPMWHRPDSRRNSGKTHYEMQINRDFTLSRENLLSYKYIRKTETISDLRFSAPLGARTLDPNIKSVVLYQLS